MAKLKNDDEVIVIAGKDKGKRGTVRRVLDSDRVVVQRCEHDQEAHQAQSPSGCGRWHR